MPFWCRKIYAYHKDKEKIMTEENREERRDDALEARNLAAGSDSESAEKMIPGIEQKIAETKEAMPKRGKVGKVFIVILAVLVVLGIVRAVQIQMTDETSEEEEVLTNVQIQSVERGEVSVVSPISGRIVSANAVNVIPLVSGEVKEVNVKEGQYVTAGQTLFTIDSEQAQIQSEQAQLGIKSAQDSVDALKVTLDRMQALYDTGAISLSDLESAQTQYNTALNSLEQAKVSAKAASSTLDYYTVTAPVSGCATSVNVVAGGAAGQTSAAVVISDTTALELQANVSEYLVNSISEGQKVDVRIKSVSDEPMTGTVITVADAPAQGSFTYEVTIALSSYENLRAGMFAEISVVTDSKAGVVAVPSEAVVKKRGEDYVALLTDENKIELRKVTTGLDNGTMTEIKSGLSPGEKLVAKGQNYVSDGEQVNVVE